MMHLILFELGRGQLIDATFNVTALTCGHLVAVFTLITAICDRAQRSLSNVVASFFVRTPTRHDT